MQLLPRVSLILLFFLVLSQAVLASEYVKLTQLNTDHGLNQSHVTSIIQDNEGYLWIGSRQGVNRYDGYRVSQIPSPENILSTNPVELIFQDKTGLIWIGSAPENNYQLDKKKNLLTQIQLNPPADYKMEYPVISKILEDGDNLWISTGFELFFFDRQKNTYEFITSPQLLFDDPKKTHLIRDLLKIDNQLLIATSNGLYVMDIATREIHLLRHTPVAVSSEDQNNVKFLTQNHERKIWVGTVEGLYELEHSSLTVGSNDFFGKEIISELNIWKLIQKEDFYWLATDQGLYKLGFNLELRFIFKYSDTPFNTSDDDINLMVEDREGSLWLGSRGDGLFKWRPSKAIREHYWQKSPPGYQLSSDDIYDIVQTPDKHIWIATQNGLNKVDGITGEVSRYFVNSNEKEVVSASTIYQVVQNKGRLWLNTLEGIKVVDQSTLKTEPLIFPETPDNVFTSNIYSLYFFDQDNLAITNEKGVYNYNLSDNTVTLIESMASRGVVKDRLTDIFDTATGDRNTYFVGGIDRLVKFDRRSGMIHPFHALPPAEQPRTNVGDIFRDGEKLWVTYPGFGVYVLNANSGEEIKFMSEADLGVNTVMDIFPDRQGNLWFTSNEGLIRLNKDDYSYRVYDSNDGFANSEFNGGTRFLLGDGRVMLGSVKGAYLFDPKQISKDRSQIIKSHITSVSLLSRKLEPRYSSYHESEVVLEHNDFGLKIEFSALLLDKPKQVKYRYWIEGDFAIEPTLTDKHELFLPKVGVGENWFKVSAIDYETGFETLAAKIKITSLPAPWLSKTAYLSYLLLSMMIFWFFYHRAHQNQLARRLSHERLKQSEERLSLALKGSNSGLWDWHAKTNTIYEPRLASASEESKDEMVLFDQRVEEIHPDDQEKFITAWAKFLNQKEGVFEAIYRMRNQEAQWVWYRDMATVTQTDEDNKPLRVTGTYTDITERKDARDKMRLYSKAFENARDIVFVLDQEKEMIAANQSFYKITGYSQDDILGRAIDFITDMQSNRKLVAEIFKTIHKEKSWEGEGLLIRDHSGPLAVLINATCFLDNDLHTNFVFALTDISRQKSAENELRKLANYDSLTGLPNRALLLDRITHALEHCRRRGQQLALFFVDLDRFKHINDTLGHDIGDLLLINVAHTIRRSIRHDDTVARLGGDEFVVMLEDIDGMDTINRVAQNIIEQMQEPLILSENQITSSPSIGIAIYPQDGDDPQQLLKHADIAMYHAKNAGRNNFQYYENSMNKAAQKRMLLENRLRRAINGNEIFLMYQPQYELGSGKLCGVEALARWKTSTGEFVSPAEFIPVAEDLGLIISMTETLLENAVSNLLRWQASGLDIGLAFNLSARHLHHYDFNHFIDNLLDEYPINAHYLEFELTESVLMDDIEVARRIFGSLAEKGIELALDDFGTGYSSLQYLNQLPINKLKIDRSFVDRIGTSNQNDAIIRMIISLAKSLNLKTVAEGIETEEQLQFLKDEGADQAQGFYLSKPISLQDLEKLLFAGH